MQTALGQSVHESKSVIARVPTRPYRPQMKPVVIAVTLLIPVVAVAQPPAPMQLQVGDSRINATLLQPYKVRWRETIVNAIHQVIERGVWDDELRREHVDGRDVLIRLITVTQPDGVVRERVKIVVDGRTFAPIRSEWSGGGRSYEYDFHGNTLKGLRVNEPGRGQVTIDVGLDRSAFDYYGGMMELFLATLPRTSGAVLTFPAALATSGPDADQAGLHWPVAEVRGEETVRSAGGDSVKAWRIEINTPYGFYKVWVTDVPPYVVRTVLLLPPGGRITYERIQ